VPAKIKPKWQFRAADFSTNNRHASQNNAYRLFFEYLRISPSYELARKEAAETLTPEEKASLPDDFDDVRATFRILGDVQRVLFRVWWYKKGLEAFGLQGRPARIHKLKILNAGEQVAAHSVAARVEEYVGRSRLDEGLPSSILLAIPLDQPKTQLMRRIGKLLDENLSVTAAKQAVPLVQIAGKRFRQKELMTGLRLLWHQAMYPEYEQWRVAVLVGINPKLSKVLDAHTDKRPDSAETVDRSLMMRSASRDFLKYKAAAENAARGHFPCYDKSEHHAAFNWKAIRLQIASRNAWEKRAKARLEQPSV
jgi:hypothetical protein